MPSQFFGLNIAYSGLVAANAALNTTGNNIANAETEGYSRQQTLQEASDALRVFTTYGCAGAGVDVLAIERVRDEFYDEKYWDNNAFAGEYRMKQYYMKQIEDYFKDDSTIEGFKTIFDNMVNALEEVAKNAGDATTKNQFIGYMGNLTQYFNSMSVNLQQVQKDANEELKARVEEINALAEEIATLNKQINVIEIDKRAIANELRDQRTVLIDRLSEIVDVEYEELPIFDTNNPDRETGAHRVIIKIAGGQKLVDTNEFNTLTCIARKPEEKVNQSDADGLYDVYWVANNRTGALGDEFNLYSPVVGGALWGLVQMRDGNNEENFRGTVTQVDQTNKQITVEVTEDYLLDMNKCKLSDTGGKIKLGNEIYYYTNWSFDSTANSYTFTIDEAANGETLRQGLRGKDASIGASVDYQGVVYYQSQMNEWVRVFSEKFNEILKSGYDDYGDPGEILLTGNKETDDSQYLFRDNLDPAAGITTVSKDSDSYYRLTAANFDVLEAIAADPDLLATKIDPAAGTDEYKNVENLKEMMYDKTVVSFRGASTSEFLTCILSDIALNANSANTFSDNFTNIAKAIDNQRMSVSSVDHDEESVNLIKSQNAYNLASRMIQCMTEVYDRLILETGV